MLRPLLEQLSEEQLVMRLNNWLDAFRIIRKFFFYTDRNNFGVKINQLTNELQLSHEI